MKRTLYTLENALEDNEPETSEEAHATAEVWQEYRERKSLTTEELTRQLGITVSLRTDASLGIKARARVF